ncbi:MAG: peptidase and in, kexin, sedolisin [Frankiales bacterium]|nr:peptidase and in, kexin, sedolisin [Frankiales bacterium]
MTLHRPRAAVAAGALLLPVLTGVAAAPTTSFVLSVGSGFRVADLPAGASVLARMPHVGAVQVLAPAGALSALARVRGVRGASPDVVLHAMSNGSGSSGGELAPSAVGGIAGAKGTGAGVVVAVLDSGVEPTTALGKSDKRLITGPDFSDSTGPRDAFGHGTFMANLIAGGKVSGDVIGIAPAASVLDVKVAGADGSTSLSKVVKGLDWVADNASDYGNRVVVSLSLGAARPTDSYGSDPLTDAADAVQSAGVPVVTAAGNDPSQVSDPGQDPQLFTIGAADTSGGSAVVAPFSGRGAPAGMRKPDVVAAGVHLLSILPDDSAIARANPGSRSGKLFRGSGTSQATAVAAGAVAAFLSGRSGVSPQDVRASFGTAASDLAGEGDGYGLLVIPTTVVDGDAGSPPPPATNPDGSPNPQASSWSASSWSASSWSASSWSASSWSASSWSASSWSASSWSASSWSASTWS